MPYFFFKKKYLKSINNVGKIFHVNFLRREQNFRLIEFKYFAEMEKGLTRMIEIFK